LIRAAGLPCLRHRNYKITMPAMLPTRDTAEHAPVRATSLHDEVAARLRLLLFERELLPGEWIDERALALR
jgi:hypothetical protein